MSKPSPQQQQNQAQQQQQRRFRDNVERDAAGDVGDQKPVGEATVLPKNQTENQITEAEEHRVAATETQEKENDSLDTLGAEIHEQETEDASSNALVDERTKREAESVLELLDKERKEIELRLHSSKSSVRTRKSYTKNLFDDDLQMPRLPAVYYEPKDTSKMNTEQLRRERLLRRHLKEKFFPTPPQHIVEKMLLQKSRADGEGTASEAATAAAALRKHRDRPWAQTTCPIHYDDTTEAQRLRSVFAQDSTKCALHKSPYLQPQARFHTRDPGNRPGVTEGTWLLARPKPDGTIAMETKHVGQPVIEGTVTYRFSDELLKARQGISKPPWRGPTCRELRPPSMVLDMEPFESFPKSNLNYAHLPQVRERAAMVRKRYIDKVRLDRSDIVSHFRGRFQDQMSVNETPLKTQQRLVEMLNRYVPATKLLQQQQQQKTRRTQDGTMLLRKTINVKSRR